MNIQYDDVTKGREINDEQKGPQDRSLGYTSGNSGGMRSEGFNLDVLSVARKV